MNTTEHDSRRASRLLTLAIALFSGLAASAGELSPADVTAAVETWLRHVVAHARPDAVVERLESCTFDGLTVAYVAHLAGGGYCLCGADDLVLPVYLYCPQGIYDPENPSNQYVVWEIGARLSNLWTASQRRDPGYEQFERALEDRAALWTQLIARQPSGAGGDNGPRGDPDTVVLPLTCTWKQRGMYDDHCPELPPGSGDHTLVGCVATAMCQIMYYWQWPPFGEGSHSHDYPYCWRDDWGLEPCANDPGIPGDFFGRLRWQSDDGGRLAMSGYWDGSIYGDALGISDDEEYLTALEALYGRMTQESTTCSASFEATTYDWSIIEDVHDEPWDPGDDEVAKLCYHAGISVDMGWGVWGSGAATETVADALEDYFRYDPDTTYTSRDVDAMTEEIRWFRPVELRGTDPQEGGHAWVVYGYDTSTDPDRLFLMNMGWGGSGDGWYSCDNVNPPGYDFNIDQAHVTQIAPERVVRFVDTGTSGGDGSPDNPYQGISYALSSAPDETTLVFKAGSTHTLVGDPVVLDKPITLKGYDVTIARQ